MFRHLLLPRLYVSSLFDINPETLYQKGIRGILFDLDNTIIPRNSDVFSDEIRNWITEVRCQYKLKACIISNNKSKRVNALAKDLGLPAICRAVKPCRKSFCDAMKLIGTSPSETAVIGDQVFTDILGGNRAGLYTILVVPMPGKDFWVTRMINRRLENIILHCFKANLNTGEKD